jgi:DNA-binding sugar fermentation-stimulating protein
MDQIEMQPPMEQPLLMKLDNLIEGRIVKRPSKMIKTPYVADICVDDHEILGHTPALGCCGLSDAGSQILMTLSPNSKTKPKNKSNLKCSHVVYLSVIKNEENTQIVGIHPKLAEKLTESALTLNLLSALQNIKSYRRETCVFVENSIDSRFDFSGVDQNDIPFIMEVKNVPLADYEDMTAKDRAKMDFSERDYNSKVAYFPDGYRKKRTDTISPRALKHIKELTLIKQTSNTRCIMCYVIQRTDANRFQPSILDPEYRNAFKDAVAAGVEIITLVVSWNQNGEARFVRDDLPIMHVV